MRPDFSSRDTAAASSDVTFPREEASRRSAMYPSRGPKPSNGSSGSRALATLARAFWSL